jgi:hypothetical protein
MDVSGAVIAGLVCTLVMTGTIVVAPRVGMTKMDIARMLGTMFVSMKQTATALGMTIHFVMGVVIALIYAWLWSLGIGSAAWWWGLVFGAAHGIVASVMLPVLKGMHPRPPEMAGGLRMMAGQLIGHLF